jgi:hypothetical protein
VGADRHNLAHLWRSVDLLPGRDRPSANAAINVKEFCRYFANRVVTIRVGTTDAHESMFSSAPAGSSFTGFQPLSVGDIIAAISRLPDKSSSADHLPVSVMKSVASELALYLMELLNRSLA